MTIQQILAAVFVFGLMIFFHELGHFSLAKLAGIQVYEFSIGFGSRLAGFRRGGTVYNLRALPLGGFVRMSGMDPEEDRREAIKRHREMIDEGISDDAPEGDIDPACRIDRDRCFSNKSVVKRMLVIAAGPLMNFFLAILLFSTVIGIFGIPVNLREAGSNVVGKVLPDRPADEAGIRRGDRIIEINGRKVETWEQITNIIHKNPGKEVQLTVVRDGISKKIEVTPVYDEENKVGLIGMHPSTKKTGLVGAVKLGTVQTYETLALTLDFLGKMFTKEVPLGELGGPVRITSELGKAAEMGPFYLLSFAGFLNIQIGLFNLLPIPALDGSRIVFLAFEGLRGRPVDPTKENFIHLVGLGLLILLIVVITYRDIVQILS